MERRLCIYLMVALEVSVGLLILNTYLGSKTLYCIGFTLSIMLCCLLEGSFSTLFNKILPSSYEFGLVNTGCVITVAVGLGRFVGSNLVTLIFRKDNEQFAGLQLFTALFLMVFINKTIILFKYPSLRRQDVPVLTK